MYQLPRLFLLFGFAVCASLLNVSAFAHSHHAKTPLQWLEYMTTQGKKLNYEGAFTYQYGDQIISAKLYQTFKDGQAKRRLVYLDGVPTEVLRQGDTMMYMKAGSANHSMSASQPGAAVAADFNSLNKRLNGLQTAYALVMDMPARIAGREAVVLKMQPRDPFRYQQKLYIDRQTGLLLKSVTMGDDTRPLERFQFVQLKIGEPIKEEAFETKTWKKSLVHTQKLLGLQSSQANFGWKLEWVPNGYTLVSSNKAKKNTSYLYSDGISSFSVYLEPGALNTAGGVMRRGASVVVSKVVTLNGSQNTAILVGDIPISTAERILQSVSIR